MKTLIKSSALALAASGMAMTALPAAAADLHTSGYSAAPAPDSWNRHRDRYERSGDYYGRSADYYGEPVYRNTRVWRGEDGRTYCRKRNGTTGLIVGGAAGALIGREIDTRGSRTVGTILGAAAGALIGREIDRGVRCR